MKSLTTPTSKMKPLAGELISVIGNPTVEVVIGALLLGLGLYLAFATEVAPTLMALGGGVAFALGALQLRRRKKQHANVSRKRMMSLIAAGGVLLAGGALALVEAAPLPTLLILLGAVCGGLGVVRLKAKRRAAQTGTAEYVDLPVAQ